MAFFSLYIRRFYSITNNNNSTPRQFQSPSHDKRRRGVADSDVRSLPVVPSGVELTECSICLTEFEDRESVKVIPYCRHGFHPVCIDTWLSTHVSCPLCRSTQLFPAAVDDVRDRDLSVVTQRV
ncbi:RING-H2 finger protein ATL57-like [Bidens hawaiensis]|uniref:RING-H2 finger protein ATL57-like n=1 Tax=Bidens hawaiensis TaxID=980011 RepID=UPI0040490D04